MVDSCFKIKKGLGGWALGHMRNVWQERRVVWEKTKQQLFPLFFTQTSQLATSSLPKNLWIILDSAIVPCPWKDDIEKSAFFPCRFFSLQFNKNVSTKMYMVCSVCTFTENFEHSKGFWKNRINFSIRRSKLRWVRNPLATLPHSPRPTQIQGMPVRYWRWCKPQNGNIHRTVSVSVVRKASKCFTDHPTLPVMGNIHEVPGGAAVPKRTNCKWNRSGLSLTSDFPLPLYTRGVRSQS